VWWSNKKNYKNAITNELFLSLSTLLYINSNNNTYLEWAQKEWLWFQHSGMINDKNLINDGLDDNCKNNGGTTWTYNQGVILGGLAYLSQITKNDSLITVANKIADAVYDSSLVYTRGGVLKEPCEGNSDCGGDGPQFKGIFIRYLGILAKQLSGDQKTKYTTWVNANADSIWNKDRTSDNECGLKWVGPVGTATATTQTSALDCFNAAILLS
jgi:predicted alpha-1,6-mannanase (GH76 family)